MYMHIRWDKIDLKHLRAQNPGMLATSFLINQFELRDYPEFDKPRGRGEVGAAGFPYLIISLMALACRGCADLWLFMKAEPEERQGMEKKMKLHYFCLY